MATDDWGGVLIEDTDDWGGVPVQPDPQPTAAPKEPGVLRKTLDTLQLGLSDMMSTTQGKTYGRSGDPTQADNLSAPTKFVKALGGDAIPAIGEAGMGLIIEGGKALLTDEQEDAIASGVSQGVEAVTESAPGKAVGAGLEKWKRASPESYALTGELLNIASAAVPVKKVNPKFADRNRKIFEKSLADRKTRETVARMTPPNPEADGYGSLDIADDVLETKYLKPNERFMGVIEEAQSAPGFNPRASHTENKNALIAEVARVNDALDFKLGNASPITSEALDNELLEAMTRAADEPLLVGDAGQSASRMYEKFNDLYVDKLDEAGNISARDLLQVRRDFDKFLEESLSNPFSYGNSAAKVATRQLRQSINKLVAEAAPEAGVADDLAKMNRLLEGRDILLPKSNIEAMTSAGRYIDRLEEATGLRQPVSPYAFESNIRRPSVLAGIGLAAGRQKISDVMKRASVAGDKAVADALRSAATDAQKAAIISAVSEEEDE